MVTINLLRIIEGVGLVAMIGLGGLGLAVLIDMIFGLFYKGN